MLQNVKWATSQDDGKKLAVKLVLLGSNLCFVQEVLVLKIITA